MKIMICGHGQHGKDTFCEFLGIPYESSSMVALDKVIWPAIGHAYETKIECFNDRANNRSVWAKLITEYNTPDLTRLARDIFSRNDIYCGIRNIEEFHACREAGLFDISIWVDASGRVGPESFASCSMIPEVCDIIIENKSSLADLRVKADRMRAIIKRDSVKDLIVDWADSVFPERTITNAIQKMVLEEIPEYLMNQRDPLELADIGILLYDIANLAGIDLDEAIRHKMEINKNRKWKINTTTGLMKHIEV